MAAKVVHNIIVDSSVAGLATVTTESPVIPSGKSVKVINFGGYDRVLGDGIGGVIALQWGNGGAWETIRAFGFGAINLELNRTFLGDGVKKFRLVRINKSATPKEMVAWLDALVL